MDKGKSMTTDFDPPVNPPTEFRPAADPTALDYHVMTPEPVTRHFVALVGCRLLALWVLVQNLGTFILVVQAFIRAFGSSRSFYEWWYPVLTLLPIAMVASVVAFLWWVAPWLASVMTGRGSNSETPVSFRIDRDDGSLLAVALTAAGALVLAGVLPELLRWMLVILHAQSFSAVWQEDVLVAAARCVIGFWMLLGSKGLAGLLIRLRKHEAHAPQRLTDVDDGPL
jgi:hypothetical protein